MSKTCRRSWLALPALCASLAACATEPPEHEHHGRFRGGEGDRDWRGGRAQGASLFISPAGQPFRSPPGQPYPVAAWFATADADHDGQLTRKELRQDARRFFQILDRNGDGVIDGPEIAAYEHGMVPEILAAADLPDPDQGERNEGEGGRGEGGRGGGRMGGHGGHRRGGGEEGGGPPAPAGGRLAHSPLGAAPYSLTFVVEPVSNADADFDGKVTLAEFLEAVDRRFDELDKAGAGYLSLGTLPKTRVQQQKRPGGHDERRDGDD